MAIEFGAHGRGLRIAPGAGQKRGHQRKIKVERRAFAHHINQARRQAFKIRGRPHAERIDQRIKHRVHHVQWPQRRDTGGVKHRGLRKHLGKQAQPNRGQMPAQRMPDDFELFSGRQYAEPSGGGGAERHREEVRTIKQQQWPGRPIGGQKKTLQFRPQHHALRDFSPERGLQSPHEIGKTHRLFNGDSERREIPICAQQILAGLLFEGNARQQRGDDIPQAGVELSAAHAEDFAGFGLEDVGGKTTAVVERDARLRDGPAPPVGGRQKRFGPARRQLPRGHGLRPHCRPAGRIRGHPVDIGQIGRYRAIE